LALGCATTETAASPEATKPAMEKKPAAPAATAPAPAAPATPDAAFRAQKPAPLPMTPSFAPPVPVVRKLKSGTELWVIENPTVPLVSVEVVIRHGVDAEPIAKAGLADLTVGLLDEGTKTRSAAKLAEAIEDLAMELTASGPRDIRAHEPSRGPHIRWT
jgi:zinc protease